MKHLLLITIVGLLCHPLVAQVAPQNNTVKNTIAFPVSISDTKTSSIVFPFDIISVDRGRKNLMVQKAKGVNNILLLKASNSSFPETNLTVITANGKLYPFVINYHANPDSLHLSMDVSEAVSPTITNSKGSGIENIQANLYHISKITKRNCWLKAGSYGITFSLHGLYVQDDVMYFQFRLSNCSNIDFTTAAFSMSIKDKKQRKRSAQQEVTIMPLAQQGDYAIIKGKNAKTVILAVPKFTIPDKKNCLIRLMEKNGGRHITLRLNNNRLVKARPVL